MCSSIDKEVARLHAETLYRPTGVAVIYQQESDEFLIIQSAKSYQPWKFPQGGIHLGELLVEGTQREVNEELGIPKESLVLQQANFYFVQLPYHEDKKKTNYTQGKAYFFSLFCYTGEKDLTLAPDEVKQALWLSYEPAQEQLGAHYNPEKVRVHREALSLARVLLA